jgi:hypothetical protein
MQSATKGLKQGWCQNEDYEIMKRVREVTDVSDPDLSTSVTQIMTQIYGLAAIPELWMTTCIR